MTAIFGTSRIIRKTQTWSGGGHLKEGVQGEQNVPRIVWVKTNAASVWVKTNAASVWVKTNAASVCISTESRLPFCWQRRFLPTRSYIHSVPPVPPQVPLT
jgi:hypothetical protein